MAELVLRLVKGSSVTNAEVDANFVALNRDSYLSTKNSTPWIGGTAVLKGHILNHLDKFYLVAASGTLNSTPPTHSSGTVTFGTAQLTYHTPEYYNARDILAKLLLVDGVGSGLDAELLSGMNASSTLPVATNKESIVSRNSVGTFQGNLAGTAELSSLTTSGNAILGDAGTDTITVNGQLSVNNTVGTAGFVLTSRGSNQSPSWESLAGATSNYLKIIANNDNAVKYITFVAGTDGQTVNIDNTTTPLTYNPSTNSISANIVGSQSGGAINATTGSFSGAVVAPSVNAPLISAASITSTNFYGSGANLTGVISFPAGTRLAFYQQSPPTGWVKDTSAGIHDSVSRIVTDTSGGLAGGATAFSSYNSVSVSGSTTLTSSQIPSHSHTYTLLNDVKHTGMTNVSNGRLDDLSTSSWFTERTYTTANTGGNLGHTHSLQANIKYHNCVIGIKS